MDWQKLYNPLISLFLRSPLHGLLGNSMMLLTFRGRQGLPQVIEDAEAVAEGLAALFRQRPACARFLGVSLAPDGAPDPDQLRRAAEGRALVRITLK